MSDEFASTGGAAATSVAGKSTGNVASDDSGVQGPQDQLLNTDRFEPQDESEHVDLGAPVELTQLDFQNEQSGDFIIEHQPKREASPDDVETEGYTGGDGAVGDGGAFQEDQTGKTPVYDERPTNENRSAFVKQNTICGDSNSYSNLNATGEEAQSRDMMQHDDAIPKKPTLGTSIRGLKHPPPGDIQSEWIFEPVKAQHASEEVDDTEDAIRRFRFASEIGMDVDVLGNEGFDQFGARVGGCSPAVSDDNDHRFDNFLAHARQTRSTQSPDTSAFNATKTEYGQNQSNLQQKVSKTAGDISQQDQGATPLPIPEFAQQPTPENPRLQGLNLGPPDSLAQSHDHATSASSTSLSNLEGSSHGHQPPLRTDANPPATQPTGGNEVMDRLPADKYHTSLDRTPGQNLLATMSNQQSKQHRFPQGPAGCNGGSHMQSISGIDQASGAGMSVPRALLYNHGGGSQQYYQGFATNPMGYPHHASNQVAMQDQLRGQQSLTPAAEAERYGAQRNGQPNLMARGHSTSSGPVSGGGVPQLTAGQQQQQHGGSSGRPNYQFGPHTGPAGAMNYPAYGMDMYGQSPMMFNPPQGLPPIQQQHGMYGFNPMNPYHPPGFMYNPNPMLIPGSNPQSFVQTGQGYGMSTVPPTGSLQKPTTSTQLPKKRQAPEHSNDDSSSDDEPLMQRTQKRNADRMGKTSGQRLVPAKHEKGQGDDDHVEDQIEREKAPTPPRALPKPQPITVPSDDNDGEEDKINWKLPDYELDSQPYDVETELGTVKVSLPGMVREPLLLTAENGIQELNLLKHVFLPTHQALATPDPDPFTSLINFHTIANIVLDAHTAYRAGNTAFQEFGIRTEDDGFIPTNFHEVNDIDEYDARVADVDEIYFATIDRWRTGLDTKKESYPLIRGVQEFNDTSLDIIYYIHENGFVREKPPQKRKERRDKGTKRGPRGQKTDEGAGAKQGSGSKADGDTTPENSKAKPKAKSAGGSSKTDKGKVNVLQPRKKVKTAPGVVVIEKK